MSAEEKAEQEAEALFKRWLERTEEVLLYEMQQKRVQDTRQLRQTLRHRLQREGKMIRGEIIFMDRGRFADMGVGRGQKIADLSSRPKSALRWKPKRWYSPGFYGRLNDLMGALGIEFTEQAMNGLLGTLKEE